MKQRIVFDDVIQFLLKSMFQISADIHAVLQQQDSVEILVAGIIIAKFSRNNNNRCIYSEYCNPVFNFSLLKKYELISLAVESTLL